MSQHAKSGEENEPTRPDQSEDDRVLDSVVDWSAARESIPGDKATFRKYTQLFRKECATHVSSLRESMRKPDFVEIRRASHTLKSAADLFSARRFFEVALELEGLAASGDANPKRAQAMRETIDLVEKEWEILDRALAKFLADSDVPREDSEYAR